MKLTYKAYNPNKKFIDTFGHTGKYSRRDPDGYHTGDCVVRSLTKLTGLDFMTVASNVAVGHGYRNVNEVTSGNQLGSSIYWLRNLGVVEVDLPQRMVGKSLNTAVAELRKDDSFLRDYGISSWKDIYISWNVTRHQVTTKNYTLYDSWDSSSRRTRGTCFIASDNSQLNKKFDWSSL